MNKIKLGNKVFYYQVFYKNNKNIYLRIKNGLLVITCHKSVSIPRIEAFIIQNQAKILEITEMEKEQLYNQESMLLFGKKYPLEVNYNLKNKVELRDDKFLISFKNDTFDKKIIEKYYIKSVLNKINDLQEELKSIFKSEISLENITYKSQLMKSRFGSCIPKKRIIKLNSILARFDEKYLKAVLIHEIIHLKVFGHQKDFYEYINKYIPEYKEIMKSLKKLSRKFEV